jgi:hypothetical protein
LALGLRRSSRASVQNIATHELFADVGADVHVLTSLGIIMLHRRAVSPGGHEPRFMSRGAVS